MKLCLAIALLGSASLAHADYSSYAPALTCAGKRFLLRFAELPNDELDYATYSEATPKSGQDLVRKVSRPGGWCKLSDGRIVEAHVVGGGDSEKYFTLSLGGKPLYFGRVYNQGSGREFNKIDSVYFDGRRLSECPGRESGGGENLKLPRKPCVDASARLKTGPVGDDEHEQIKREDASKALGQPSATCRGLFALEQTCFDKTGKDGWATCDVDNDGTLDQVVKFAERDGAEGETLIVAPKHADPSKLSLILNYLRRGSDDEHFRDKLKSYGARAISISPAGTEPDFVSNVIITTDGQTYVRSTEANPSVVPAQTISLIKGDQTTTVCQRANLRFDFTNLGPSFNCAKARSVVERTICGDYILARLDKSLAEAYAKRKDAGGAKLATAQRAFVKTRDRCGADAACLNKVMLQRATELLH